MKEGANDQGLMIVMKDGMRMAMVVKVVMGCLNEKKKMMMMMVVLIQSFPRHCDAMVMPMLVRWGCR